MTTVLVVDDSRFARVVVGGILADHGFQVETAADGRRAVESVAERDVDVVTMDVEMPGIDGIEATERIMAENPTPVVVLSDHSDPGAEATVGALARGAVDVIHKPVDGDEVTSLGGDLVETVEAAAEIDPASLSGAAGAVATDPSPPTAGEPSAGDAADAPDAAVDAADADDDGGADCPPDVEGTLSEVRRRAADVGATVAGDDAESGDADPGEVSVDVSGAGADGAIDADAAEGVDADAAEGVDADTDADADGEADVDAAEGVDADGGADTGAGSRTPEDDDGTVPDAGARSGAAAGDAPDGPDGPAADRRPDPPVTTVDVEEVADTALDAVGLGRLELDGPGDGDAVTVEPLAGVPTDDGTTVEAGVEVPPPASDGDAVPGADEPAPAAPEALADGPPAFPPTVVVGASTGGPGVVEELLASLAPSASARVLVVQHMPETFTGRFAGRLDRASAYDVREAAPDGETSVAPGEAVVARGGRHLRVVDDDADHLVVRTEHGPPVHSVRPAVDVTMESAAAVLGDGPGSLVGVVLSGMGKDGAAGAEAVAAAGGTVLAQDEATSPVFGMPRNTIETGRVDAVVPREKLPRAVHEALSNQPVQV